MDELLEQFLIEGPELAQRAGEDLLALERTPNDAALIDSAFRAIHTLKGSAGLFDLAPMSRTLHAAEDLLDAVRQRRRAASPDLIDGLLAVVDRVEAWLDALARDGVLAPGAIGEAERLVARMTDALGKDSETEIRPRSMIVDEAWAKTIKGKHPELTGPLVAIRYRPDAQAYFRGDDPLAVARNTPGLLAMDVTTGDALASDDYDPFVCLLGFDLLSDAILDQIVEAFRLVKDQVQIAQVGAGESVEALATPSDRSVSASSFLRVDGRQIDVLAEAADQLVIAKNALLGLPDPSGDLARVQARIDSLATELHRGVMRLRMTPLAPVLRRLDRQVRQLSAELGKDVEVDVRGHAVEADKAVVDGLYEPLLHLVRNALDHGLEGPADRIQAGKPARGVLSVRARVDGDEVEVEVRDDGRGMDPQRLREAARARGLGDRIDLDGLSDQAALELIFTPGFSTAASVGSVSGRGVGMDAVKEAVSALGGRIAVDSMAGQGAVVTLRLPLTVVMTRILIVEAAGGQYGLLLSDIHETLKIGRDDITAVRLGAAIVVRERVIPCIRLSELVSPDRETDPDSGLTIVVTDSDEGMLALGVDSVQQRLEVVLKPLSGLLSEVPGALGTTLLGDGTLLLVLDVKALVR